MNLRELLLFAVAGWSAVGVIGTLVSWKRRERTKAVRGAAWVAGIWAVYLCVLIIVSVVQPQRTVTMGQEQCFGDMCFAVTGVQELPGFLIRDGSRLVRVSIRVRNSRRNGARSEGSIRAYLVDAQGRRWEESAGINGVPLTARVMAGGSVVSEPVFRVAKNATGLGIMLTRGWMQPDLFVIGNSNSLLHPRTVVKLEE